MISSYRLGDLVFVGIDDNAKKTLLLEHPNSFGSKYIYEKIANSSRNNIDIITEIILENMKKYEDFLPKDISDSTLIHLRLGDVVAGNEWHEKLKRPLEVDHIKRILENNTDKKYVIGKCFFAGPSSTNYEECIELSNIYLQNVIKEIDGEHFNSENADIDLCCAVKSKLFIQGRGYFSDLIAKVRNKLNLNNIETEVLH